MTRCKVISRYGIGVDMIDLQAAGEHGIPVANVPDFCIEEVSDSTIGFFFESQPPHLRPRPLGALRWLGIDATDPLLAPRPPARSDPWHRRAGQHRPGCGAEGRLPGAELLGYDPYTVPEQIADLGVELVALDDLLRRSDYVTLTAPSLPKHAG